jgi:D-tyrosyl-tRNA(Tyr) deacylase
MRAVVQRVSRGRVIVSGEVVAEIGLGLVVLLGVSANDDQEHARYLVDKIVSLRIFDDGEGKMDLSVNQVNGALLVVSQFTLYGDVRRGRRPSWSEAAPPDTAVVLYDYFVEEARKLVSRVETGTFRAMMQVELVNDGPVTIIIDSNKQF